MTPQHRYAWFRDLLFILPALLVGCHGEPPPAGGTDAPKASVIRPEKRELTNHLEFNGWTQPDKIQEVRSRVRGHIQKVDFEDGQKVEKGKPLFQIDPRPFQAQLDQANAQVKSAEAMQNLAR